MQKIAKNRPTMDFFADRILDVLNLTLRQAHDGLMSTAKKVPDIFD